MTKKVISILLVVLIAVSAAAVSITTFTAATYNGLVLESNKLYFDTAGSGWDITDSDIVSFYVYSLTNGELISWGGKKLRGDKVEGTDTLWEYDPAAKLGSLFDPEDHYFVIFYISGAGYETYALLFDKSCLGHFARCDGSTCENPVDSSKTSQIAYWYGAIDPKVCGPRLAITSTGNVVGSCVEYGKTAYSIFTTFLTDTGAQSLANARQYTVDTGLKTEQKMIDDIGAGLGLTKQDVYDAFAYTGVETTWKYTASTLPGSVDLPTQDPTQYTGDCTWGLVGGVLTISGNGKMGSYDTTSGNRAPWYDYRSGINEVVIEDGVTTVGKYTIYNCNNLKKVTIGSSVTGIGISAFRYCEKLTSVDIPDSVTIIADEAFRNCTSLTSVDIGDSVTSIGGSAFLDCTSLASVDIPDSVTSIGGLAFFRCTSLTSVDIGDSVTSIGSYAFKGCTSLTSVDIGDSVTSIGIEAFYGCRSLADVTIGNYIKNISYHAFYGSEKLKSVTIPASLSGIGDEAFGYYNDEDFGTTMKVSGFTIYGYSGTAAESYAKDNGFIFVSLDGVPTEAPTQRPTQAPTEAPTQPYNYDLIGDVDNDGDVTSLDITYIQRWLVNYSVPYPVGEKRN